MHEFQGDAGLEVDGLVGPDTWEVIGDGTSRRRQRRRRNVDPWSVIFEPARTMSDQWEHDVGLVYTSPQFGTDVDAPTGAP